MTDTVANINGVLRISPDHSLLSELGFKYTDVYNFWYSFKESGDEFFQIPHEELNKDKLTLWKQVAPYFEVCHLALMPNLVERADFPPLFHSITTKWVIARKFLIKEEWNSKTIIHRKKKVRDGHEPLGKLLIRYWYLAERCHALQDRADIKIPFENASHWFCIVFLELVLADLINTLYPPKKIYNNNMKQGWLEIERERLRSLRDSKNPFTENHRTPALVLLIRSALKLKESDRFLENFWNPFVSAYISYVQSLDSLSWQRIYVKDGKIYHQCGEGKRGTIFIGLVEDCKKAFFGSLAPYGF